jgi:hypothetical protein
LTLSLPIATESKTLAHFCPYDIFVDEGKKAKVIEFLIPYDKSTTMAHLKRKVIELSKSDSSITSRLQVASVKDCTIARIWKDSDKIGMFDGAKGELLIVYETRGDQHQFEIEWLVSSKVSKKAPKGSQERMSYVLPRYQSFDPSSTTVLDVKK